MLGMDGRATRTHVGARNPSNCRAPPSRQRPFNEPLTTARFSALYGLWYPHHRSDQSFIRAVLNQVWGGRAGDAGDSRSESGRPSDPNGGLREMLRHMGHTVSLCDCDRSARTASASASTLSPRMAVHLARKARSIVTSEARIMVSNISRRFVEGRV
jgi:hypothetical protein